jgi:methionyl-tRNA synthetase
MKNYYLTTTLPYVNASPHLGFALEIIQADVLARYHTGNDEKVFFNTGTDEHGQKIYQKAIENKKSPQDYVDQYAAQFDHLKHALNLSYNNFIRTTDKHHITAAQEMWRLCEASGDIYKANYKIKYCVGCELEKQDSELEIDKCPIHPNLELEIREEENYFFRFSRYQQKLLNLYNKYPDYVVPSNRLLEVKNFVSSGLQDFSISRLKEKMPWGVPVPGDERHVQFVWFDALTNYISALGWPEDSKKFAEFWGTNEHPLAVQVAGKDNLRQQSAMWQAMLMSAGLPPTRQILIHGFITSGGQKMSKSLGNVVDPFDYVDKLRYGGGADALRYYLLAKMNPFEDSDFTKEKFEEAYQADLANGLGNLVARVAAMAEKSDSRFEKIDSRMSTEITTLLDEYKFDSAMANIWERIKKADQFVSEKRVWELKDQDKEEALTQLVGDIRQIAVDLQLFLPQTAEKIAKQFGSEKIVKSEALFPRLI